MQPRQTPQSQLDIADWNRIAGDYAAHGEASDPHQNPMYAHLADLLWASLGNLSHLNVLDIGCGDGWLSGMMRAAGAQVWGVDGSEQLLGYARTRYPDIEFIQADLATGIPSAGPQFDRIVSTMVLMDIPDLSLLIRDVRQRLTEAGRFIFVILHPCFFQYKILLDEASQTWYRRVTNYQDPQVWRIDSFGGHNHYHRNLTYYTELLRAYDLAITRFVEPEWVGQPDAANAHVVRQWPICLLVEARPFSLR